MSENITAPPRVWVGCLGCYSAGHLVGDWFDASSAPSEMDEWNETVGVARRVDLAEDHFADDHEVGHEELWVMDHEGFHGLLKGECSPTGAKILAGVLNRILENGFDAHRLAAFAVYVSDHLGCEVAQQDWDAAVAEFEDAFSCVHISGAAFAEDLAEELAPDLAAPGGGYLWPLTCIDWDHAWRELTASGDYWSSPAPDGGGLFIFRAV